ncbi:MAG: hypothetical protein ACRC3B_21740, partial [Bacteroidia bacterium]
TANEIIEGEHPPLIPDTWLDTAKKDSLPRIDSAEKESLHINHSIEENQSDSFLGTKSFSQNIRLGDFIYEHDNDSLRFGHPSESPDVPIIYSALEKRLTESQIFVDEQYNSIVKGLMIDSGYGNREQLLPALKRRNIKVYDSPPRRAAEPKK